MIVVLWNEAETRQNEIRFDSIRKCSIYLSCICVWWHVLIDVVCHQISPGAMSGTTTNTKTAFNNIHHAVTKTTKKAIISNTNASSAITIGKSAITSAASVDTISHFKTINVTFFDWMTETVIDCTLVSNSTCHTVSNYKHQEDHRVSEAIDLLHCSMLLFGNCREMNKRMWAGACIWYFSLGICRHYI